MIVSKKSIPRRAILRGVGASIALPLLDSMIPALAAAPAPVRRFGAFYVPMGADMARWTPATDGPLELSPILKPLASFKERLVVVSGLDSAQAEGNDGGPHPKAQTTWLTGARANRSEGPDIRCGVSMDQVAGRVLGQDTQLATLELALESPELLGACALGYSCTYTGTIAWRNATTPLPMDNNPRVVFERLFGATSSTDARARLALARDDRSILDAVMEKLARLEKGIGPDDRIKLAQYLDSIREVERGIQKVEEQATRELPIVDRPVGIPDRFEDHARLMFDLLALAYQCDLTRVGSFLFGRELSTRTFPEAGIAESWHPLSHHANDPAKLVLQAKLNTYHIQTFRYLLEKLRATPEGDGSLLDHTMLLYGSGMGNSDLHLPVDVPTLVVTGPEFGIRGDRHIKCEGVMPLANLQLTMLRRMGVDVESFGDSTRELSEL